MSIEILGPEDPQQYVSISLVSVFLSRQFELLDHHRKTLKKHTNIQSVMLLGLGLYDICVINVGEKLQSLFELQDMPLLPGTQHQRYYYGRVIGYSPKHRGNSKLDLSGLVKDNPLAGISFVKFKKELYTKFMEEPAETYSLIAENILQAPKKVDPIVCLGFGVEDLIILYFGDSFETIEGSICKLRSLSAKKVFTQRTNSAKRPTNVGKIRHLVSATYTIPAIYADQEDKEPHTAALKRILGKITNHKVWGGIQAQVLPGHLGYVKNILNIKGKAGSSCVTMGRNDFLVFPKKSERLSQFLSRYIQVYEALCPKSANEKPYSPVISMETMIGLDSKRILEDKWPSKLLPCLKKRPIYTGKVKTEDALFKHIKGAKCLPDYTGRAISTMLQDMSNLLQISVVNDSVISLHEAYKILARKISKEWKKNYRIVREETPFGRYGDFYEETSRLLDLLHLCFLHRYPGEFAVGEQAALPVTTHKTTLQKYLNFVDYACAAIYDISCKLTTKRSAFKKIKPCCYVGNSPSPWVSLFRYYPIAIINIPTSCLYNIPRWLHFIGHEIGHVYIDQWDLDEFYSTIEKKIKRWVSGLKMVNAQKDYFMVLALITVWQCLADFYECQLLLDGNIERFKELYDPLASKILGSSKTVPEDSKVRKVILTIMKKASDDIKSITNQKQLAKIYEKEELSIKFTKLCDKIAAILVDELRSNSDLSKLFSTLKEFPSLLQKQRNAKAKFIKDFSEFVLAPMEHKDWERKYEFCNFLARTHKEALKEFFHKSLCN